MTYKEFKNQKMCSWVYLQTQFMRVGQGDGFWQIPTESDMVDSHLIIDLEIYQDCLMLNGSIGVKQGLKCIAK